MLSKDFKDERLSQNFSLLELVKSNQGTRQGIDNTPSEEVTNNLKTLVKCLLQPLRSKIGAPIVVSSGYRSPELNKAIGGATNSDHCKGYAVDFEVFGIANDVLFEYIKSNFKFTKLILEFWDEKNPNGSWIHVSYNKDDLKCQCLKAVKQKGKTVYLPA